SHSLFSSQRSHLSFIPESQILNHVAPDLLSLITLSLTILLARACSPKLITVARLSSQPPKARRCHHRSSSSTTHTKKRREDEEDPAS
ncbi:unnamed protein product, partial [Brassica oleracea var. botrytis]